MIERLHIIASPPSSRRRLQQPPLRYLGYTAAAHRRLVRISLLACGAAKGAALPFVFLLYYKYDNLLPRTFSDFALQLLAHSQLALVYALSG